MVATTRALGTFQGRGDQTIGIVSESGRLRVTWETRNESPPGSGTFRLALHSAVSGRPIELITDQRGASEGSRDVADDPRPYNLMVESANLDWSFSVEEIVAAPSQQPVSKQPEPPYAGEWIVTVIDNIKVMPDSQVTLTVTGTTVSGLASCNSYRGAFTVDGTNVKVGDILKTMKACDGPRMSQEADFLALLRTVVRYEVRPNNTLVLTTVTGKTITATRPPDP